MTATELFVILVALAFIGGVRAARGSSSVWGLASGVEYVVLGLVLGPKFLGVLTHRTVEGFEALLLMGLGWLLAVRGVNFGFFGEVRQSVGRVVLAVASVAACCGFVFATVHWLALRLHIGEATFLAVGLAAVCAESSHLRPETEVGGRASPLARVEQRWSIGSELVPILLLGTMVLSEPFPSVPIPAGPLHTLSSVVLGFVLGGVVTALVDTHFERSELWPVLLGAVLLVVGTALRLDLPAVSPAFVLGMTVSLLSRHRDEVRNIMNGTERQLLLPCLLLAGALLQLPKNASQWLLVGCAVAARLVFKAFWGIVVAGDSGSFARRVAVGSRVLQRASGFSIAIGLAVFLRQSDDVGRIVLTTAAISVLLGDLIAPRTVAESPRTAPVEEAPAQIEQGAS